MLLLSFALATPAETLRTTSEGLTDPPASSGVMQHQGHDSTPGATRAHPFVASVEGPFAQWTGDSWTEAAWITTRVFGLHDDVWTLTDAHAETAVIQLLAAHPKRLLEHMALQPARLAESPDGVLWSTPDGLWTLTLADGKPQRLHTARSHPVFGDVVDEVRWSWDPPRVDIAMTAPDTRWTATLTPDPGAAVAKAPSPPAQVTSVALGKTTWAIQVPEANGRSLMTVWGHEGVVFDSPLRSSLGEAQLAEARRRAPQVTDWTVVVSHHHPHYTGGLRPWARAGATILVPASILETVRTQLTEARTLDPSDPVAVEPKLVPVSAEQSLMAGRVLVKPIDEASGHTEGFLMSFVVPEGLLYIADLGNRSLGEQRAKHRGTWVDALQPWTPTQVVSGWPLEGTDDVWPFSSL